LRNDLVRRHFPRPHFAVFGERPLGQLRSEAILGHLRRLQWREVARTRFAPQLGLWGFALRCVLFLPQRSVTDRNEKSSNGC
jgi:hypothetical protein